MYEAFLRVRKKNAVAFSRANMRTRARIINVSSASSIDFSHSSSIFYGFCETRPAVEEKITSKYVVESAEYERERQGTTVVR